MIFISVSSTNITHTHTNTNTHMLTTMGLSVEEMAQQKKGKRVLRLVRIFFLRNKKIPKSDKKEEILFYFCIFASKEGKSKKIDIQIVYSSLNSHIIFEKKQKKENPCLFLPLCFNFFFNVFLPPPTITFRFHFMFFLFFLKIPNI